MTKESNKNVTISNNIVELQNSLSTAQQFKLVQHIAMNDTDGEEALLQLLIHRRIVLSADLSYLDSVLFEKLYSSNIDKIKQSLKSYFPNGIVQLESNLQLDYQPLQELLINHSYKEADKLTQLKLCQLAALNHKTQRKWLYFTDIPLLPSDDLATIDILWRVYSRDKFGFSRQRHIWLSNNCNWDKLWIQIGWVNQGITLRYPNEFIWDINAPRGHLPLFNQLRGVQVLFALFNHVVWQT